MGCCGTGSFTMHCCGCGNEDTGGPALTPAIGENGNWWIGDKDTGVKAQGADGITPHIGENGDWFLGDTDTGVKAQGVEGPQGPAGPQGPIGPQGPKGDSGLMEEVYSTTPQRIGTWIDGRPIYRRAFVYNGTIPKSDGTTSAVVIIVPESQLGSFHEIIKVYGRAVNDTEGGIWSFPAMKIAGNYFPGKGIRLTSNIFGGLRDVVAIVEYT